MATLRLALAAALLLGLATCASDAPAAYEVPAKGGPRHVLIFLVDTLRADHMACYDYPRDTTPFLDDFLERGVRFDKAISQSSWTAPSVISLFTGRDVVGEAVALPAALPTLPEVFQGAGYRTGGFVLNPLIQNAENGFRRGFERFQTERAVRKAMTWIKNSKGKDTLTYVHMVTTHDPYAIDPKYHHFTGGPGLVPDEVEARWSAAAEDGLDLSDEVREEMTQARNGYDDDVRLADSQFGTLVAELERTGQLDNAVIIFCSDHGEGLWTREAFDFSPEAQGATTVEARFKMTHGGQLYDELVHTPLMIWAPGVEGGRQVSSVTSNVDILPTLLELCDLAPPSDATGALSGTSLAPAMYVDTTDTGADAGEHLAGPRNAMTATRYAHALYSWPYKLIEPTQLGLAEGLVPELFDLVADPGEDHDLTAELPEVLARLRAELAERRRSAVLDPEAELELTDANRAAMRALGYTD